MSKFASLMLLADWRGDLTEFGGSYSTTPIAEHVALPWDAYCERLAPSHGPTVTADKSRAIYVLPCLLAVGQLVGKTREKAIAHGRPAFGKQRSASHATEARAVLQEFDGIQCTQFESGIRGLKRAGVASLSYTTHSIGAKPGLRARVIVPVDKPLDTAGYAAAHAAINATFFGGIADRTGGRLSQQQGVWVVHPDRVHLARRWAFGGGVLAVSELVSEVRGAITPSAERAPFQKARPIQAIALLPPSIAQVEGAMKLFDPNDFHDWDRVVSLGVALAGYGGQFANEVQQSVEDFSNAAGADAKAKNAQPQYDPLARFQNWAPAIPANVAAATLFGEARDRARRIVKGALESGRWAGTRPAREYLGVYHRRVWDEIYQAASEVAQ